MKRLAPSGPSTCFPAGLEEAAAPRPVAAVTLLAKPEGGSFTVTTILTDIKSFYICLKLKLNHFPVSFSAKINSEYCWEGHKGQES